MKTGTPNAVLQMAAVTLTGRAKDVKVFGPHGTRTVSMSQPSEVGLAVIEVLTGEMVSPPVAYRKGESE